MARTSEFHASLRARLVRYADLVAAAGKPATLAPARELFAIIAADLNRGAAGFLHISEPHGFAVTGVRHPAGCAALRESPGAAQVVIVHAGHWQLQLGLNAELGSLDLGPGDVVSVPVGACRSLQQPAGDDGFVLVVSGSGEAPDAVASAATGTWIDFSNGVPLLREMAGADGTARAGDAFGWVVRAGTPDRNQRSALHAAGVEETGLIGSRATRDRFEPSPASINWTHGFALRRLTLQSGAYVPLHSRSESEVLFVQSGALEVSLPDGTVMVAPGDTLSVPAQLMHAFRNTSSQPATLFVIRGSEDPAAPQFQSIPVHISAA